MYASIGDDMAGATGDLVSGKKLSRFYPSINHGEVYGDAARHAVSKVAPPPNPMKMDEAREFIHDYASRFQEKGRLRR
jgi:hypothetical protein